MNRCLSPWREVIDPGFDSWRAHQGAWQTAPHPLLYGKDSKLDYRKWAKRLLFTAYVVEIVNAILRLRMLKKH